MVDFRARVEYIKDEPENPVIPESKKVLFLFVCLFVVFVLFLNLFLLVGG